MSELTPGLWPPRELKEIKVQLTPGEEEVMRIVNNSFNLEQLTQRLENLIAHPKPGIDDYSVRDEYGDPQLLDVILDELSSQQVELTRLPLIMRADVGRVLTRDIKYRAGPASESNRSQTVVEHGP